MLVVFALNGAVLGTWAPRVPALTEQIHAVPGSFGVALLGASVGMVVAAFVSGRLIEWGGSRAIVVFSALASCVTLPLLGLSGSVGWLGISLLALGTSVGLLDVSMNMAAVTVERCARQPIMPAFHAAFSFGALAGSAAAGLAASHRWSPFGHFTTAAVVGALVLVVVARRLPGHTPANSGAPAAMGGVVTPARRVVLWLLAAIAMCSAIAEGASGDWSSLLLVTERGMSESAAALAFSGFSLSMAVARLGGAWLQQRFGPTRALTFGAACAGTALVAAALVPFPVVAYAGFAVAGAGLAASFPIALSLAGEAGKRADGRGGEREIAFVAGLAYSGLLAGPPLIGAIAQVTSLSTSFVAVGLVVTLIVPAAIFAHRARNREQAMSR